jgi:hypothetical protein
MTPEEENKLQNMSHADFVVGMQNKTLGCWLAEPYQLRNGLRKTFFNLLFLLYIVGPLIFVPLLAYRTNNWWFLIGIATSYLGTASAGKYSRLIYYFGCYWTGFLIQHGFSVFHYTTFYFLCAAYGYLLWHLADTMRMGCARQSLIDREDIYENAIIKNRLRIIKLDLAGHEITTSADFAAFEDTRLLPLVSFPTVLVFSNILIEAVTYLVGFLLGLIKTAIAHARGIDNLAPDKADSTMRQLKKGTVGLIAVGLGYVGIYSVWGLLAGVLYIGLIVWLSFAQKKSTRVSNSNP